MGGDRERPSVGVGPGKEEGRWRGWGGVRQLEGPGQLLCGKSPVWRLPQGWEVVGDDQQEMGRWAGPTGILEWI